MRTWGEISSAFGGDIRYTVDDTGEFPHILMEQGGRERKYLWQENTLCGMPEEGRYVLTDPLGTPLVVAGPDGQVQDAYRYDEFGLSEYRREEAPLPFGFTGYLADRVDGLYYANAREYHAGSGRFLTKDLNHYMDLEDPGTLNLYQYAKGNPLKYVDPSGHESINEETSYLIRTMNMVMYGSFTNEFTWAGLGVQLVLGFTGLDAIFDARDLIADATVNRDLGSPGWWFTMALDIAAVIPVVGLIKYSDDLIYGVKALFKNGDDVLDGSRKLIRAADSLGDLSKTGRTVWDHMADSLREMAKTVKKADMLDNARYVDNAVDAVSDTGKRLDDVIENGKNSVDDIIKGVENGNISLSNNIQKGNYGEMKMDAYFESQGYERISLDKVTDLNTSTHQGIDGVYYNPDGHPPYIIGEAKYGSSRLSTLADGTPQMSTEWIEGGKGTPRLELSVGKNVADDILLEGYDSVLVNIDKEGNIITHMLDENGQIVK